MKIFQVVGGFCHYDATRLYYNATEAAKHYSPDTMWVDAPDHVFEGWGYDASKKGDDRFIQPLPPEGWEYDPKTGSFYESGETPPSKRPTMEERFATVAAAACAFAAISTEIPDASALEMATLFPTWAEVLSNGAELARGRVISKDGQLYRVVQAVTPQAHQEPGGEGMLAVYRPIDREHAGTLEDPIPWVYGMDCHAGLYYSYNGAIYKVADGGDMIPCVWAPDTPGLWQWETV